MCIGKKTTKDSKETKRNNLNGIDIFKKSKNLSETGFFIIKEMKKLKTDQNQSKNTDQIQKSNFIFERKIKKTEFNKIRKTVETSLYNIEG